MTANDIIDALNLYADQSHWTTTPRTPAIWNPRRDPNLSDQPWLMAGVALGAIFAEPEWLPNSTTGASLDMVCPWCRGGMREGHTGDCARKHERS